MFACLCRDKKLSLFSLCWKGSFFSSINLASRAAPAPNAAFSYGYPSPSMMNGYGPPPAAPPSYAYPPPGQQNGFYQGPPPPPAAAGNMGYHNPTAPPGRTPNGCFGCGFFVWFFFFLRLLFCALGMYPTGFDYMAPPPPYPGPPQNWAPPPQNWTATAPPSGKSFQFFFPRTRLCFGSWCVTAPVRCDLALFFALILNHIESCHPQRRGRCLIRYMSKLLKVSPLFFPLTPCGLECKQSHCGPSLAACSDVTVARLYFSES